MIFEDFVDRRSRLEHPADLANPVGVSRGKHLRPRAPSDYVDAIVPPGRKPLPAVLEFTHDARERQLEDVVRRHALLSGHERRLACLEQTPPSFDRSVSGIPKDRDAPEIMRRIPLREEAAEYALDAGVLQMKLHDRGAQLLRRIEDHRQRRSIAPLDSEHNHRVHVDRTA